jgi:ferric iron reductase protein FhuF
MTAIPHPPESRPDGADLLARTAELGEYFAIPRLTAGAGEGLAALLLDEATVRDFVDRTQSAIAASTQCAPSRIPLRMAASSFQMGVLARLMSPVVGAAITTGAVPWFTLESVRWRGTTGHSARFGVVDLDWVQAPTPTRAAAAIAASLLASIVGPFNDALAATVSLSPQVSWGNTISAANGAVTVMAMTRPDLEPSGRALVRALLDTEPLRNTADLGDGRFLRRSCCLFYQAPGAGLCGDCVLTASG